MATKEIERYYNMVVGQNDRDIVFFGDTSGSLEGAKKQLAKQIAFYHELYPGEVTYTMSHDCARCGGSGKVQMPPKRGHIYGEYKTCPVCRGKDSSIKIL